MIVNQSPQIRPQDLLYTGSEVSLCSKGNSFCHVYQPVCHLSHAQHSTHFLSSGSSGHTKNSYAKMQVVAPCSVFTVMLWLFSALWGKLGPGETKHLPDTYVVQHFHKFKNCNGLVWLQSMLWHFQKTVNAPWDSTAEIWASYRGEARSNRDQFLPRLSYIKRFARPGHTDQQSQLQWKLKQEDYGPRTV